MNRLANGDTELYDGARVSSLIDAARRKVSARVLVDPEIFELERELIFKKAWMVVGHASEIPNEHDYMQRYLGADPVVVTRAEDGGVTIFLNFCAHRGMQVCRSDAGNARRFTCPYHGWTYDSTGQLRGVPLEKARYGPDFDKSQISLRRARAAEYAGWIFGTWDEDAPPLEEYLGDFRWYMDLMWSRTEGGFEVAGPPQRWVIPTNWKLATDQFSGDAYHILWLHRSLFEIDYMPGIDADVEGINGVDISCNGHSTRGFDFTAMVEAVGGPEHALEMLPPPGMSREQLPELFARYSDEEIAVLANHSLLGGHIFPNFSWLCFRLAATDGTFKSTVTPRLWMPRGPDHTEVMLWPVAERDALEADKRETIETTIRNFSSSGIWEQDDAESWSSIQRLLRGSVTREQWLDYSAVSELDRGDWPGGGAIFRGVNRDETQWLAWARYFAFLRGEPWLDVSGNGARADATTVPPELSRR
jgi:phenylpropionate dioxygenase-like ring-hydroxylating dioxygenase large terminal subunit